MPNKHFLMISGSFVCRVKENVRSQELWFPDESHYITSSSGDNISTDLICVTIFTTQEVYKLCTRRHLFLFSDNEKHLFMHLIFLSQHENANTREQVSRYSFYYTVFFLHEWNVVLTNQKPG